MQQSVARSSLCGTSDVPLHASDVPWRSTVRAGTTLPMSRLYSLQDSS